MSWFSRKSKGPASLEEAIRRAKDNVSAHLHTLPIDVVEHVTEYRDGRSGWRNDTNGHHSMRKWLQTLKELRDRVDYLEQAEAKRDQIAAHLGLPAAALDMDGLLRLLHEADNHAASEPEPTNG
ncbi:hypothetical protein [Stenotrophomonas maltophilia]|uniref:hypothetical protein n=1 Tax=Stenotrophomonas maltophilia TaxID=40324 RepID=UPI0039C4A407